jgi:CheY-like chemotaxis protein
VQVEVPTEPLWLEGDPVRLAQILSNLLNNAAKYSEAAGTVTVRCRSHEGDAVVSVSDTGMGIDPDTLPLMFEMFARGHRDNGRTQGGLGIGLALSKRLAEMHGGTLTGHSKGLGKGSEFVVRLPLAAGVGPVAQSAPADISEDPAGLAILVVDDNEDAGESLGQVLTLMGCDARVVRSGQDALNCLTTFQADVVLLDIGMPGMNGYETARAIRARFPHSAMSLIALTGWGQHDDRQRAREAGFDHHLTKPADIATLKELLVARRANISGSIASAT